jgi:hypothetical protein
MTALQVRAGSECGEVLLGQFDHNGRADNRAKHKHATWSPGGGRLSAGQFTRCANSRLEFTVADDGPSPTRTARQDVKYCESLMVANRSIAARIPGGAPWL